MKRVMIWAGSVLFLLMLAIIGLLIALPFIVDPNDYKGKIETLVYEKSGYQLKIPGDIDLQITPGLDVLFSLGQVQVQSVADSSGLPLLSSDEARVEFSLIPLLREKRLAIQGIKLHGVYCNLIRNKAGKGNWEIVPPAGVAVNKPQQTSAQDISKQKKSKTSSPVFDLGFLDVSKLTVRYEDQQTNKRFELKDFSVKTGRVQDGQPFHVQSAFTLISSGDGSAALALSSELTSDVLLSLAGNTVDLSSFVLHSTVSGFGLQKTELQLALDASLNLAGKNVVLKTAALSSGLLTVQLEAEVHDFENPVLQGSLTIPAFSLHQFLADNKMDQPLWVDDSALRDVGFSCRFRGDKKKIAVSDMAITLDGAQGSGQFELLDPEHPSYDVKMHFDRLNLDRYAVQAATSPSTTPPKPSSGTGGGSSTPHDVVSQDAQAVPPQAIFPVEMLRELNFQLDFTADAMQMKGAKFGHVELKATGSNGRLRLDPLRAELYRGSIAAQSTLDVSGKVPQLKLQSDLQNVQVGPLLQDMTGKAELTGSAVLSLQIGSRGNMKKQLLRHMNGTMNISLKDGVIRKLHILQVIRQAKALYEREQVVSAAKDEPTGFAHISASGVIKNGVMFNKDLQATSDLMKVTGSGRVDLVKEYVDYLLQVSLTRALDRDKKTGKTDFGKYEVPYKIRGYFSQLKQEADLAGVLKSQAKNLLINELQKQLNKNDDHSESGADKSGTEKLLEKGLKSLFGN